MKIDKLTLKNFKFFYGEETLDFESKNVLIYGENGRAIPPQTTVLEEKYDNLK